MLGQSNVKHPRMYEFVRNCLLFTSIIDDNLVKVCRIFQEFNIGRRLT